MALIHHAFQPPTLPYISNISITDPRPYYAAGSNVLTSIKGQLEKRPGHTQFESSPTTFGQPVQRLFGWRLWGGAFFVHANIVGGGNSVVYKYQIGTDVSFGSLFSSASAVPFDFITSNNLIYFGNGTDMKKWDGTTLTGWGIAKPAAAPGASSGAGSVSAAAGGFSWKYAFGNSSTGHIGQISAASAYTGNLTSKEWTITGSNTADGQVDKIHIYRTADGGATYYELPNSPIAYVGGWSVVDNNLTNTLNTANQASLNGQNAPPPAAKCCVFYAGRVWVASGDKLYYSCFEELINGVAVESFPATNFYTFGQEITGTAVCQNSLLVFTRSSIFRITGDSLATFVRKTFKVRSGVDHQSCIASGGQNVLAWIDTTNTIWVSDGVTAQEIGLPIRTDVASWTQTTTSITFHTDGIRRWLMATDTGSNKAWVYDADIGQWMVPWTLGGYAVNSIETSPAVFQLLRTTNAGTQVLQMAPATFTDVGSSYAESLTLGLMPMYAMMGSTGGAGKVAAFEYVSVSRNSIALSDVQVFTDDNPLTASGTSIFSAEIDPPDRVQGANLIEKWYPMRGSGNQVTSRRGSVKLVWNAQNSKWILNAFDFVTSLVEEIYGEPGGGQEVG